MLFQCRSLATAVSLAPQFLLSANIPQYIALFKSTIFFGCDVVWSGRSLPILGGTFCLLQGRRISHTTASRVFASAFSSTLKTVIAFFRNVHELTPDYTASHPIRCVLSSGDSRLCSSVFPFLAWLCWASPLGPQFAALRLTRGVQLCG
jgi:hypothetical protein